LDCITSWRFYGGRSYCFSNQTLSWQNSKEYCNQMNAHLVEIQSAEENQRILSL
uniref:C-type lectin domain-containing protein n=1 Tax=Magallana gigas TaxID=29159 RepID=A0A8W8IJ22_MAGGI